jgi:plastocyanin
MNTTRIYMTGLIALFLTLGACGGDDAAPVEVVGSDYAFSGLPETVAAGTEVSFLNSSTAEAHEMVAIRLPDDEERSMEELVQTPGALEAFFSEVKMVLVAGPGEAGVAVEGPAVFAEAGRYAVICVIPTGADPAEYLAAAAAAEGGPPDVAGGPPHLVHGMFAEVTVTP